MFFTVIVPGDPSRTRAENYRDALDGYAPICQAVTDAGAMLAIEGAPGKPPHYANLCCTPETVRAFLFQRALELVIGGNELRHAFAGNGPENIGEPRVPVDERAEAVERDPLVAHGCL